MKDRYGEPDVTESDLKMTMVIVPVLKPTFLLMACWLIHQLFQGELYGYYNNSL